MKYIETMDEFGDLMEGSKSKLVVVDFFAEWCGPCKRVAPIYEHLSNQIPDVEFVKVDVDEADEVSAACGIQAMPTFQFFKEGKMISEVRGADVGRIQQIIAANK